MSSSDSETDEEDELYINVMGHGMVRFSSDYERDIHIVLINGTWYYRHDVEPEEDEYPEQ
jgi:hypothetical protein